MLCFLDVAVVVVVVSWLQGRRATYGFVSNEMQFAVGKKKQSKATVSLTSQGSGLGSMNYFRRLCLHFCN